MPAKVPEFVKQEDREAVEKILASYPQLMENADAGAQAADLTKRLSALEAQRTEEVKNYTAWKQWYDEKFPKAQLVETENETLRARVQELESAAPKPADIAGAGGGDVPNGTESFAALEAKMQAGFLTKSEFEAQVKKLTEDLPKQIIDRYWKEAYPQGAKAQRDLMKAMNRFSREYPAEADGLDVDAFVKYAAENQFKDYDTAYGAFTSERREKSKIDAAVSKAKADWDAAQAQRNLPGSAPVRPNDLGILEARARGVKPQVEIPAEAKLGQGVAGRMAAEELRREGKEDYDGQRRGMPA